LQNSNDLESALVKSISNLQFIQEFLNDIAAAVNSYNSKILLMIQFIKIIAPVF